MSLRSRGASRDRVHAAAQSCLAVHTATPRAASPGRPVACVARHSIRRGDLS